MISLLKKIYRIDTHEVTGQHDSKLQIGTQLKTKAFKRFSRWNRAVRKMFITLSQLFTQLAHKQIYIVYRSVIEKLFEETQFINKVIFIKTSKQKLAQNEACKFPQRNHQIKYVPRCVFFIFDNSGMFMSHSPQKVCKKPLSKSNLYCPTCINQVWTGFTAY